MFYTGEESFNRALKLACISLGLAAGSCYGMDSLIPEGMTKKDMCAYLEGALLTQAVIDALVELPEAEQFVAREHLSFFIHANFLAPLPGADAAEERAEAPEERFARFVDAQCAALSDFSEKADAYRLQDDPIILFKNYAQANGYAGDFPFISPKLLEAELSRFKAKIEENLRALISKPKLYDAYNVWLKKFFNGTPVNEAYIAQACDELSRLTSGRLLSLTQYRERRAGISSGEAADGTVSSEAASFHDSSSGHSSDQEQ